MMSWRKGQPSAEKDTSSDPNNGQDEVLNDDDDSLDSMGSMESLDSLPPFSPLFKRKLSKQLTPTKGGAGDDASTSGDSKKGSGGGGSSSPMKWFRKQKKVATPPLTVDASPTDGKVVVDSDDKAIESEESEAADTTTTVTVASNDEEIFSTRERCDTLPTDNTSASTFGTSSVVVNDNVNAMSSDMELILNDTVAGISVQEYFNIAWSEGDGTTTPSLYGSWLVSQEKHNVVVNPWEATVDTDTFTHRRIVTFDFEKTTLGIQSNVQVEHLQQYKLSNEQCVVHMTISMKGFPYSDCFVVEVCHVASLNANGELEVQIRMNVKFVKASMMEWKIRNNTTAETKKAQLDLYETIKAACLEDVEGRSKLEEVVTLSEATELLRREAFDAAAVAVAGNEVILITPPAANKNECCWCPTFLRSKSKQAVVPPQTEEDTWYDSVESLRGELRSLLAQASISSSVHRDAILSEICVIEKSLDTISSLSMND